MRKLDSVTMKNKMITAILEDSKGFRISYDFARFMPKIEIPIPPKLRIAYKDDILEEPQPNFKRMTFNFYKWLEKNKVALYREEL